MSRILLPFTSRARLPFIFGAAIFLLGLVALVSPVQLPVVIYKVLLCLLGGLAGYVVDGAAFPFAAPDSYLEDDWKKHPDADGGKGKADFPILDAYYEAFIIACIRRATCIIGGMAVVGLGI